MAEGLIHVNSEVESLTVGPNDTNDIKYNSSPYIDSMAGYSLKKIGNIVIFSFVVHVNSAAAATKVMFAIKNSNILPKFNTGEQIHFPVTTSTAWNSGTVGINDVYMITNDINIYNRFPIAAGTHMSGTMIWTV